jgi:hypothetical protein
MNIRARLINPKDYTQNQDAQNMIAKIDKVPGKLAWKFY